ITGTCQGYDATTLPPPGIIWYPQIAEGVDAEAENEFACLKDSVNQATTVVQGIGLTLGDIATLAERQAALIWSPRSNISLYGYTANVILAYRFGVPIALGSDWLETGSMSLSREMACADGLNRSYFGNFFTDADLVAMVTSNAAIAAHVDRSLGALKPGLVA